MNRNKWKGKWHGQYLMDKYEIKYCRNKQEVKFWQEHRTLEYGKGIFKKISD